MAFRAGQKVVCVDDTPKEPWSHEVYCGLTKGSIYTIRFIHNEFVWLEEIHRPKIGNIVPADWPFNARRFRPIVERKTNITIFKKMLLPNKVTA